VRPWEGDLLSPCGVRETDLHMDLQTAGTQDGLVDHVESGASGVRGGERGREGGDLLVIPMMRMLFKLSTPSILERSWLTMLSFTPVLSLWVEGEGVRGGGGRGGTWCCLWSS
jgi:hypothetical protein